MHYTLTLFSKDQNQSKENQRYTSSHFSSYYSVSVCRYLVQTLPFHVTDC